MKLLVLPMLLVSLSNPSQASSEAEFTATINKISQAREALRLSASGQKYCETPQSTQCTYEGYCDKLAGKASDFYLYQDADGRQVPNMQMSISMKFVESCVGKPFPEAPVQDPFVYPEQFFDAAKAGGPENLKKNRERYATELKRVDKVFADAKDKVIKALELKKTPANKAQVDQMIAKVKAAKMRHLKLSGGPYMLAEEGCEAPNAYYRPDLNTVTVCPHYLNLPDASLFSTLSHELGHAIDSCNAFANEEGEINTPPEKNPFSQVLSCLQSDDSIGVKVPSQQSLIMQVNEEEDALKEETASEAQEIGEGGEEGNFTDAAEAQFEDRRKEIEGKYENHKHCASMTGSGHMQEAFSDWISSQALAVKLSEIPESGKAREFAFASQAVFYGIDCANVKQATLEKMRATAGKSCKAFDALEAFLSTEDHSHGDESTSHPKSARRINRIYYAKPEIQKALGCQAHGDNGKECQ
ncbi:DUF4344 domain-containing metallopeptidase [Bdellovibrio reynosensis]|uniref:DUF4344 domain-containing metallopeptidase n=1 Tax=Bdellovibrio reynosensis TaxID=2835041 RepID=A0ABY4C9T5_9BACT|nr:DUF4344 domain-containing metallopeptidase [Bdellovibrio reynosensis]UOF01549.1 DUF4344 domain-containing metallopeptidase [Bdellovibrio reynosensis]